VLFASLAALIIVGGAGFSAVAVARPMIYAVVFEPEREHLNWATFQAVLLLIQQSYPTKCLKLNLPPRRTAKS
jgi:hypothetical protein